jgi:2-methylcitrate dehydratase PrpD
VRSIVCRVAPGTERMLQYEIPAAGLEGKFSMHYCLAVAALYGAPWIEHFRDEAVRDPALLATAAKVTMVPDPALRTTSLGVSTAASVAVTDERGQTYERTVLSPVGSGKRPLETDQVREKFLKCCAASVGARAPELFDRLMDLDSESDVAGLVDRLAVKSNTRPVAV